jgi:hypothetical protein
MTLLTFWTRSDSLALVMDRLAALVSLKNKQDIKDTFNDEKIIYFLNKIFNNTVNI